jgi:hypothetical protein
MGDDRPAESPGLADSMVSSGVEMDMEVRNRVHIVPLGYERDRVVVPPVRMGADVVVLLKHAGDASDDRPDYYDDIFAAFEESAIQVVEVDADIFDLYDALGTIAGLIREHDHDDVYVNLATGGKVTAIAGMIACMVTEAATPYYVGADTYGDHRQEPVARDVTSISNLPTYPIDAPTPEQVQLLAYIAEEEPVSKKQLIAYAERHDLPFIAGYEGGDVKGKYRKLDSAILTPLVEDGAVSLEQQGRRKVARITPDGENTLRGFRYMIERGDTP